MPRSTGRRRWSGCPSGHKGRQESMRARSLGFDSLAGLGFALHRRVHHVGFFEVAFERSGQSDSASHVVLLHGFAPHRSCPRRWITRRPATFVFSLLKNGLPSSCSHSHSPSSKSPAPSFRAPGIRSWCVIEQDRFAAVAGQGRGLGRQFARTIAHSDSSSVANVEPNANSDAEAVCPRSPRSCPGGCREQARALLPAGVEGTERTDRAAPAAETLSPGQTGFGHHTQGHFSAESSEGVVADVVGVEFTSSFVLGRDDHDFAAGSVPLREGCAPRGWRSG